MTIAPYTRCPCCSADCTMEGFNELAQICVCGWSGSYPEPLLWQPIETAPKDGTRILVWPYWSDGLPAEVKWRNMKRTAGRWEYGGLFCNANPTHWMPLPAAPNT